MTSEDAKEVARRFFNDEYELGDERLWIEPLKAVMRKLLTDIFVAFSEETEWGAWEVGLVLQSKNPDGPQSWFSSYEMPIDITITPDDLISAFNVTASIWEDEQEALREAIAKWRAAVETLEEKFKR
jgi:hypothetical protein